MYILGLSCFYHDAAACLLKDGVPIAASDQQAFSRKKHDSDFPVQAIRFCLETAGITADQLDAVAFYDKPLMKFDRLLRYQLHHFPSTYRTFVDAMPRWIATKLRLPKCLKDNFGYTGAILYSEHHLSHAASAYYTSGFEEAAVLTVDGVGEWATASWGRGKGHDLELLGEIKFPHSLGLLYSAFTYYCGFKVNSAEYKLMGLAPYGQPTMVDKVRKFIDVKDDGSFRLNMEYFSYERGEAMFNEKFEEVMGRPRRPLEHKGMDDFYMDAARSIQEVTNEIMVKLARSAMERAGSKNLCMAGGVALNCVANGHILRDSGVENLYVQPSAGDAGGAMGAAYVVWNQLLQNPVGPRLPTPYLGAGYDEAEIKKTLDRYGAVYKRMEKDELCTRVAELLDTAHVVGWYQGRMEWGPRALGHRTILGDARHPEMRTIINMRIKFREGFRPFAPSCLEEHVGEYFEIDRPSPYMLLVAPVKEEHREGLKAITHIDGSARIQTINQDQDALYYDLIKAFYDRTGCPIVINTSLNVRGEPIVNTPEDSYLCFMRTDMDAMALGPFLCMKEEQPEIELKSAKEEFGLD
ncbi:MAG: carbamoyltransferase [Proteobacteria bacterium]|nr:carbamoyltransferase [Pseudomonadota bacterium]MCP4920198.1 carbamoyltransferase [Pseudomonadota bacterium]